jgi:hypothetical protein
MAYLLLGRRHNPHSAILRHCALIYRVIGEPPPKTEETPMAKRVATRIIKPWTKEDVRDLKAHSKHKTPVAKVSKEMKRTIGGLRRKAGIIGIGLGHQR